MIDIRFIRENPELVAKKAKQKGYDVDIARLAEMESKRATLVPKIENLQSERNTLAQKGKSGNPQPEDIERGTKVAGAKFYFTKGSLVELEIAILQFG